MLKQEPPEMGDWCCTGALPKLKALWTGTLGAVPSDYQGCPEVRRHPRLDVILTSCLVFIWLNFMRSDFDASLNHLKSGLKIVQDFRQPNGSQGLKFHHIDASLIRLFAQLEIQATVLSSPTSDFNSEALFSPPESTTTLQSSFSSIKQAKNCLANLLGSAFRFIRQIHDPDLSHPWPDALSIETICRLHLRQFRQWQAAIRNSPPSTFKEFDPRQATAVSLLHLHHKTVSILLETLFTPSQVIYDLYDTSFEQVLSLAKYLIHNSQNIGLIVFFDRGVIAPLFYVILNAGRSLYDEERCPC